MKYSLPVALLAAIASPALTNAQEWADVTIKFVLDGASPAGAAVNANADAFCAKQQIPTERLVVDAGSKGIANMVFMIDGKQTKLSTDQVHPSLKDVPSTKPVLDNVNCRFIPHILPIRVGQTIEVKNSDSTSHNAKFVLQQR